MSTVPVEPIKSEEPRGLWAGYAREPWPLAGYAALIAGYAAGGSALLFAAARTKRLPAEITARDILLLGVATHKLTRILTKDWVTSPLRAPFTEFERSLGHGEQSEKSRGSGLRRAMGDLLTCPWCSGPWVATALFGGLVFRPRATRLIAGMLASVAISDYLHDLRDYARVSARGLPESPRPEPAPAGQGAEIPARSVPEGGERPGVRRGRASVPRKETK